MAHYNLEHSYNKFCGKKFKDSLSSFLPQLPGVIDTPGHSDNSSLRSVIDKPPIGGKELIPLNSVQLSGFRLHPGPVCHFTLFFYSNKLTTLYHSSFLNSIRQYPSHQRRNRSIKSTRKTTSLCLKSVWVVSQHLWPVHQVRQVLDPEPSRTRRSIRNKNVTKMRRIARRRRRRRRKRSRNTAPNIRALLSVVIHRLAICRPYLYFKIYLAKCKS